MIELEGMAELQAELVSLTETVRAYSETDVSKAAVRMLDALMASYVPDLMNCMPDKLGFHQAAMQQAMALRKVFAGEEFSDPRV
jgi:hypothetical protein